ncbi:MAG: hypothetical protein OHK0048_01950 [Rhodoferax sp.]
MDAPEWVGSVRSGATRRRGWPRTASGLQRINRELRRRTRAASIFPNPDSCSRLVSALLAELDDEWMVGKV